MTSPGRRELALLVFSVAFALLACELAFRAFLPLSSRRSRYARLRQVIQYDPRFVVEDPELGWAMRPGLDLPFDNPEEGGFSTRVRTNSAGFRDDEASLADPRILVLGDSFAFGWGVEESEALPARLEAGLGAKVLNLGVSGYGTVQQLIQLRRLALRLPLGGRTVVLLSFFNDLEDNLRTGFQVAPWIERTGPPPVLGFPGPGRLAPWMEMMTQTSITWTPARYSHLAYLGARLANKLRRLGQTPIAAHSPPPAESEAERRALFAAALGAIRDECSNAGAQLALVHVPAPASFEEGAMTGFERVEEAASRLGVRTMDSRSWLRAGDYWRLDGHWTASGHAAVAASLVAALGPSVIPGR